jgi:hypothetical protein
MYKNQLKETQVIEGNRRGGGERKESKRTITPVKSM